MKTVFTLLTLLFISSSFAQTPPELVKKASGGSVGTGGDALTAEKVIILTMIKSNLLKLEKFLRTDKRARDYFSKIDQKEFSQRILDVVQNNKIKLIKNGDKENDNDALTEIHDKYGVARTAVNYFDTNIIEYDFEKVSQLQDKPKVLFVLNAHEILSLMGLEQTDPTKEDQYMGHEVSGEFAKFLTKVGSFDLIFQDNIQRKQKKEDLEKTGNIFNFETMYENQCEFENKYLDYVSRRENKRRRRKKEECLKKKKSILKLKPHSIVLYARAQLNCQGWLPSSGHEGQLQIMDNQLKKLAELEVSTKKHRPKSPYEKYKSFSYKEIVLILNEEIELSQITFHTIDYHPCVYTIAGIKSDSIK